MDALLGAAEWMVGKALAPVADGVLEAWDASKNLGLNINALRAELFLVKATLEIASSKQIAGQAMQGLLWKLRDLASCAEDLLDELEYFRIHDELHGTYNAADQHAKGRVHDFAISARHTARAVLGLSSAATLAEPGPTQVVEDARQRIGCCAWPRARQRSSFSRPNANQADEEQVRGCVPKLGKLLPFSSSPHVQDDNSGDQSTLCGAPQREYADEAPMLRFNRIDISERMKHIVEQLQPARSEFTTILQSCDRITGPNIAQSRPITTGRSIVPKLYGRDHVVSSIINDMTKGKYHGNNLTVLPVVGPGGIGKTTLIQHIYHDKEVQNHFQVVIWVCVSLSFNLNKLLEDIKKDIPSVQGEKGHRPEELIEQRIHSKRFLLVLDDIWGCSNEDDWEKLLLPLKTSQEMGSMILVTTRSPAIAKMVKTTDHIELEGIESKEFRKLFLEFVFGGEPIRSDHSILLQIGDKIIEKLKGSPLAAKTVGRLLSKDLNVRHWRRVLESKEWERQTGANDIMPALKLSYDYLPFHQQQCFSYSALFPEDFHFSSGQLINLWIGLDILQPSAPNQTLEEIGLRNLNDLVTHGFFREEGTDGCLSYVMHDLLHNLALQVASADCITLHHSNVGSVGIQPSIRHLSIIIDDDDDLVSHEKFKGQLRNLKTRLNVKQLHTLILFGKMHESFVSILGDLFSEANALRLLHMDNMPSSVESILHNFSSLVHLRYLYLGAKYGRKIHLPVAISRFYHLRILGLPRWCSGYVLPKDFSNLAKLRRFYTPDDEIHSDIRNVGKLKLLEELMVFRVNKESEGFEPNQLEHLTELRKLGVYNLENIHTREEAAKAKLIEKNFLERLTLDWDSGRSNIEPSVEAVVLESLQPHRYLEELCIRGHRGTSCPAWLGDELAVEALQSLHLDGVSWKYLPPLGKMWGLGEVILKHITTVKEFVIEEVFCRLKRLELVGLESFEKWVPSQDAHIFPLLQVLIIRDCPKLAVLPFSNPNQDWSIDWFPKLQELKIERCPELMLVVRIPWTETLRLVSITNVKLLQNFEYHSKSSCLRIIGKDDLGSLDQVLAFSNLTGLGKLILLECPPLELNQLLMLTSLKQLVVHSSDGLAGPLGGDDDVEWQHPVTQLAVIELRGTSGKELTELLTHFPRLSKLEICICKNITQLAVGVDEQQQTTSAAASEAEEEEDGLLVLPAPLCDSLQELTIEDCRELVLVSPLQALRSLREIFIRRCPKFLSVARSYSCCPFPSSLTQLELWNCGMALTFKDLGPLLTAGGQLRSITVFDTPRFFAEWDTIRPRQVLLQEDGGEKQQLVSPAAICSSKLQDFSTDDALGFLAAPICSILFTFLTHLKLYGDYSSGMERFTKEQEDALHLLASLQDLLIANFDKLQHLPAGLRRLSNLKRLEVYKCPAMRSLPKDGLPESLEVLDVRSCHNEELIQHCRGLRGTIPTIILEYGD